MAVGRHGHEMLGAVQVEVGEGVDAVMRQKGGGIGAFDDDLVHVVRLIKQHGGLPPRHLFIAPVLEFRGHHGVDIHPGLGVAQQGDRIAGRSHDG